MWCWFGIVVHDVDAHFLFVVVDIDVGRRMTCRLFALGTITERTHQLGTAIHTADDSAASQLVIVESVHTYYFVLINC